MRSIAGALWESYLLDLLALLERGLTGLHPSVQLVYLHLWARAFLRPLLAGLEEGGTCSPTQAEVTRWTGLGTRTIQRALRNLVALGLIQVVAPGGGKSPAVYRVFLPKGLEPDRPAAGRLGPGRRSLRLPPEPGPAAARTEPGPEPGVGPPRTLQALLAIMAPQDRELLEDFLDRLPQAERKTLQEEAVEALQAEGEQPSPDLVAGRVAELVLQRHFGPARAGRYLHLPHE